MKKIIFCLLIALTSCQQSSHRENLELEETKSIRVDFGNIRRPIDIGKFQYEGHSYIIFDIYSDNGTIIHDPDCPCHNNE